MIGSLRGVLSERWDGEVLVEVAGIGYRVVVTPTTAVGLAEPGDEVFLYVHDHVREDARTLYGFASADELHCFEALIGAHGVGPALALGILGVHPPASLARVLADEDLAALCLVPGVGKKTAARLMIELRTRVKIDSIPTAGGVPESTAPVGGGDSPRTDVRDALTSLGYGPEEVSEVLANLGDDGDASSLLRDALQRLAVR